MKDENRFDLLGRRERDVVNLLLEGRSNKQIALMLAISERTIEYHLKNSYEKYRVASRVGLILKLGKSSGSLRANPVESTVDHGSGCIDNGNQPRWAESLRNMVSLIKKEVAMTIRISFEELRDHPVVFSLVVFPAAPA